VTQRGIGATQAFLAAQGAFPIKEPIVDSQMNGDFYVRVGVSVLTSATAVKIALPGRKPSFFFFNTNNGSVVYQTTSDVTNSTPGSFVCRATAGCVANLVVG
jgi:hypothetical protein